MNIEESIQQINELIEAWELNEACLNQTDIDAIKCLLKQNKELKQKYLNAVADYETTMFEKEQLNSLVNSCQEKIRRLKKQLEDTNEELELVRCDLHNRTSERYGYYREIEILENQQKKFIEYLEYQVKLQEELNDKLLATGFEEILSKYKEIIGGKE